MFTRLPSWRVMDHWRLVRLHPHHRRQQQPMPIWTARRHCGCTTAIGIDIASIQLGATPPAAATLRGRVEHVRVRGKLAFIHLRQPPFHSIQVVAVGAGMARQVKDLTPESIVDVTGAVVPAEKPVTSVSCTNYELHAERIHVVSKADTPLPFPIKDCHTKLDTRLNHRVVDLRTPLMASMLRIVSAICQCFREKLLARGFLEIHTPKLIGTASEGGSAVFSLDYFDQRGYLAQSPQLYKQMALMGDAMRVFEIAPVFRAEKSLTHRHLTEFVGLDAELVIGESYTEVLDVLEATVCGMIEHVQTQHSALVQQAQKSLAELDAAESSNTSPTTSERSPPPTAIVCEVAEETIARYQLTTSDATATEGNAAVASLDRYHGRVGGGRPRVLRLAFCDAVQMLLDHNVISQPVTDFTLPQERRLGELVRERYGVDVYIVDQFPTSARPFYTMPHPCKADVTCSFDMYLRGEEICSGAQRVHDPALLLQNMQRLQVDAAQMTDYVSAFRYGAWPHGGFGLGLERIALFLLGARDIRQVSLFPRDPKRLAP
ncbi:aspartyl-tRNA synthetase [Trypanosoma grayi]|uniref:aspartyl-tRNA synthetase n=1 Tax=Trypanosoma grayi TaxID=71804 RepID=UPI0004F48DD9|nr:aspartyl-tRNA synthetase [Trypanosoma grayi]KEG09827.1 aspartyl-tRNA synthetase [Trypanosoma grayi]